MKIIKLIIPLLGLTSINNNANKELLQIEKEIKPVSYEILAESDWDNYLAVESLMKNEVIQLNTQNFLAESSGSLIMPISHGDGCWVIYLAAVSACQATWFFNPSSYGPCMRQAWRAYMACEHGYVN